MSQFRNPRKLKLEWRKMIQISKERRRIRSLVYPEDDSIELLEISHIKASILNIYKFHYKTKLYESRIDYIKIEMTELRKRLNSSMTYEEYLHTFDQPPKKPNLKPKQDPVAEIDELDLLIDTPDPFTTKYRPKLIIQEESEELQNLPTCDSLPSFQTKDSR